MRDWRIWDSEVERLHLQPLKLPRVKAPRSSFVHDMLMTTARIRIEQERYQDEIDADKNVPLPWPAYTKQDSDTIIRLAEEMGSEEIVLAYELGHKNRSEIIEALSGEEGTISAIIQA